MGVRGSARSQNWLGGVAKGGAGGVRSRIWVGSVMRHARRHRCLESVLNVPRWEISTNNQ